MTRWNERTQSQDPALALLRSLGYTYVAPEALEAERESLKHPVLAGRLAAALCKLNPWLTDELDVARAVKAITRLAASSLMEANQELHTVLTYGMSLDRVRGQDPDEHDKSRTVRFFDFDDVHANDLVVTDEYLVQGGDKTIRADVVVLVNGLPLAVIECKSPTKGETWRAEAITQLTRYQELTDEFRGQGAPRLFETVQLVIACCGQGAVYGTVGTPGRFYVAWPEAYPRSADELAHAHGAGRVTLSASRPTAQDIALYSLLAPENLLDITRGFVVFEVEGGRTVRKVCRYKQRIAVDRALRRIHGHTGQERGGVVWHTQGSGKSLTMLWLALKLRRDPRLENPTLVVVTDRVDLDKQIRDTFEDCGFPNPERAGSVRELRTLLQKAGGRTIMTTVQKFQDAALAPGKKTSAKASASAGGRRARRAGWNALSQADNIFVMVDEAHRTQYKSLAANMRAALPNACFLGFTGTPIDKNDRSTLATFGPYIDTYTIEQAVADGATVPIKYESRLPELRVMGQSLDRLFERVFADHTDEERAAIKRKFATERAIACAPKRVEAICLDLIEHLETSIRPNGFKAQVVASSREAAVLYKETLDRLNAPPSALIMSAQHNEAAHLVKWRLGKHHKDTIIAAFKERDDPVILVVCDMLLTGFDAPVEQVMYLDSPLREHTLLQAIARVNRRAADKTHGLVVDYWGVSEALQEALSVFSPADIKGALEPKHDELPRLGARHGVAMGFFAGVRDKDDLNACVDALAAEDRRADFDQAFRRLAQSMDMLLPDPRALAYTDDVRWLGKIRAAARARYRDPGLDLSGCGAKVQKLIADAVVADGIQILVKEVSLFSREFDERLEALGSSEARASEMEHALRHEIHVKLEEDPAFYQSLRERLEEIIELREQQRISAAEQLELFQAECDKIRDRAGVARDMGLSETGYAIHGLLTQGPGGTSRARDRAGDEADAMRQVAGVLDDVVAKWTRLVDWQHKDDVQREMRSAIKWVLRGNVAADRVESLANAIVELAKHRRRG